jgi:prefoldin subunit 5
MEMLMSDINPIETARELATHANDIEHLQADMDKLIKDMEEVKKSLATIQQMLGEQSASKKTLHGVLTVCAGLAGGIIVWILDRWIK